MSVSVDRSQPNELLDEAISLNYKKGDVILAEGDFPNKTMYLLLQGELKVYKERNNQLEEISQIQEGEFFGEIALISDSPRTATVKVVSENAKIIQFSKESFIHNSKNNPALVFSILKATVARIFRAEILFEKLLKFSQNFSPELIIKLNQKKSEILDQRVKEYLAFFKPVHYSKGDKIIAEGTLPLGYMYYVFEGDVRAVKNINGKVCYLNHYPKGCLFGEISFFSGMKSFASYYAVQDSYIIYIDKKIFYKILEIHPEFIFEQLQNFIWKLVNTEKANQILKNQAEKKPRESDIRIYNKGDIILREGDPSNETMYYVLKGELNVYKNRGSNLELINLITKGDFFGELSLISNQPRTATIEVASETAELVLFSKKKFIEQTKTNPNLMMSILKATIARLVKAETSLSKMIFKIPDLDSDLKIRLDQSRVENINIFRYVNSVYTSILLKGEKVYSEKDPSNGCMYFLLEGQLSIQKVINKRRYKLTTLEKGDFFGEVSLVSNMPRYNNVVVVSEKARVASIDMKILSRIIKLNPALLLSMLRTVIWKLIIIENAVTKLNIEYEIYENKLIGRRLLS